MNKFFFIEKEEFLEFIVDENWIYFNLDFGNYLTTQIRPQCDEEEKIIKKKLFDWLESKIQGKVVIYYYHAHSPYRIYFEYEEDAVNFKLKWN